MEYIKLGQDLVEQAPIIAVIMICTIVIGYIRSTNSKLKAIIDKLDALPDKFVSHETGEQRAKAIEKLNDITVSEKTCKLKHDEVEKRLVRVEKLWNGRLNNT